MKRLLLLLLASAVVPCASASAQITNPDVITGVKIDGKNPEANTFFINSDQCAEDSKEEDVEIEVRLAGLNEPPFLEVWRTNSSESCHLMGGRMVGTAGGAAACTRIGEARQNPGSSLTLKYTASELFSKDGACDVSGAVKIYFVPLDNETPIDATAGVAEGLGQPAYVTFNVDFDPPSEPTGVKGSPGENQIRVSWKSSGETSNTSAGFTIYYDPEGISKIGEDCVSTNLVKGKAPKDLNTLESGSEGAGSTSTSKSPASLGLNYGEQIPVAVVAKDQAGNRSALSEVICVGRIKTDGFYEKSGGKGLEECSAHAPGRASLTGLGSLSLLAFALVARRRRAT